MSQAHNRITAYHWYLGSAFWRERREHIIHSDCPESIHWSPCISFSTRHGGCPVPHPLPSPAHQTTAISPLGWQRRRSPAEQPSVCLGGTQQLPPSN